MNGRVITLICACLMWCMTPAPATAQSSDDGRYDFGLSVVETLGLPLRVKPTSWSKTKRMARSLGLKNVKSKSRNGQRYADWEGMGALVSGQDVRLEMDVSDCPSTGKLYHMTIAAYDVPAEDQKALADLLGSRRDLLSLDGARRSLHISAPGRFDEGYKKTNGELAYATLSFDPTQELIGQVRLQARYVCLK